MTDVIQFDPALKELLLRKTGDPLGDFSTAEVAAEEVPVAALLKDPAIPVEGLRVVARFGSNIVTGCVPLKRIVEVRGHSNVFSLKPSKKNGPDLYYSVPEILASRQKIERSIPGGLTGRGVVLGVADWGCDFAHANFRDPNGRTRLLYLWDQRGGLRPESPEPFGYGREFDRDAINRALSQPDPYAALGYDPQDADQDGRGSHGCFVQDIAAGNGSAPDSSPGVAPDADLIFVHLKEDDTRLTDTLGGSVRLLEAVRYIVDRARVGERSGDRDKPVVVSLSLGWTGGPKDGTRIVPRGLDAILEEQPGCACVMSTGNYYEADLHSYGQIATGEHADLRWRVTPRNDEIAEMEVWYDGSDDFSVELIDPNGQTLATVALGESVAVRDSGRIIASCHNRKKDPLNEDNNANVFIWEDAPMGTWTTRLHGNQVTDGRYHAWIERDDPQFQSRFTPEYVTRTTTVNTVCCGLRTIAVSAYDARDEGRRLLSASSSGPTRDGRQVPVISAPGVGIRAARSSSLNAFGFREMDGITVKSGSSMAAPHVAGVCCLMFEAAGSYRLSADETRDILIKTARASPPHNAMDRLRYGAGRVDAVAAVEAVRELVQSKAMSAGHPRIEGIARAETAPIAITPLVDTNGRRKVMSNGDKVIVSSPTVQEVTDNLNFDSGDMLEEGEFYGKAGWDAFLDPEHFAEDGLLAEHEYVGAEEYAPQTAVGGGHNAALSKRLAAVLPRLLVELGDSELKRADESGAPLYDKRQPLLFAPTGRKYELTAGEFNYHAANFVYNTAYELGYEVPVFPITNEFASDGRSYNNTAATFESLIAGHDNDNPDSFMRFFEVIAHPGQGQPIDIREGDLFLRGAEAGAPYGHLAIIADPALREMSDPFFLRRDSTEGKGVHCIDAGVSINARGSRFGRALLGEDGRVLDSRMVLRIKESAIDVTRVTERMALDESYREAVGPAFRPVGMGQGSGSTGTAPGFVSNAGAAGSYSEDSRNVEAAPFKSITFLPVAGVFDSIPITQEDHSGSVPGATRPYTITETSFRKIDDLKILNYKRIAADTYYAYSLDDALLSTSIFRKDPADATRFQIPLDSTICYPADPKNSKALAPGGDRFPVVLIVHGQHQSYDFNVTPTAPLTRLASGMRVAPARVTGIASNVANHEGFRYLQEALARLGIVSISIGTNPANFMGSFIRMRADMILANLDYLRRLGKDKGSRFFGRLDFDRVGLIGHSRGGDAVAKAVKINREERKGSRKFGIDTVIAIAPTDFTGTLIDSKRLTTDSTDILVIYGSHDGDVSGIGGPEGVTGTGFRHYDRAKGRRAMVFIHGANHNRFNTNWGLHDNPRNPDKDKRILSDADHRELAKTYITRWLRGVLFGQTELWSLFQGYFMGYNLLGKPVTLQWEFGNNIKRIDNFQDSVPGQNRIGGKVTPAPFTDEVELAAEGDQFPHQDKVLLVDGTKSTKGTYRSAIPVGHRDWSSYNNLIFRITKKFDVSTEKSLGVDPFPKFSIRLVDDSGKHATLDQDSIYGANISAPNRPYFRILGPKNLTKNPMETLRAPLSMFAEINLKDVRHIELRVDPVQPDKIYIDNLTLT